MGDGTELTGQAACDAVHVSTGPPVPNTFPLPAYLQLTHLPAVPALGRPGSSPQAPAVNPGKWYRPINQCHFQDPFFEAAGYPAPACPNTPALTQWPTKDNAYIASYVDRSFGPAAGGHNVAVVTGKMPTTPATYRNNPSFAFSDTDQELLDDLIGEELAELGYGDGAGAGTSGGQRLVRPSANGRTGQRLVRPFADG